MSNTLNEDMMVKLAAQFNTLPDLLRVATDQYVPQDESPAFYKGYINAVMMLASLLSEQKIQINYDVLVALAGKAAQLRQKLIEDEQDTAWLDQVDRWLQSNYKAEAARSTRH